MESLPLFPPPPDLKDLTWCGLARADLPAVAALAHACHQTDGGLGFLFAPDVLQGAYFLEAPNNAIGGFRPDGSLATSAAVRITREIAASTQQAVHRALIVGMVHPDQRSRGIGGYLMRWSQAHAQALFPDFPESVVRVKRVLRISTELLTDAAHHLYAAHGFERVFEELVMSQRIHAVLPEAPLPPEVTLSQWSSDREQQFFQAYTNAFRDRPGFPGWTAAEWIDHTLDEDFNRAWSLLARAQGVPVGFITVYNDPLADPPGGFVGQIGVVPEWRRRGLASAIMVAAMRRMQAARADLVQLTVATNNPGAISTYTRLGFAVTGRRARYDRLII